MRTTARAGRGARRGLVLSVALVVVLAAGMSCGSDGAPVSEGQRSGPSQRATADGDLERSLSQQLQTDPAVQREFLYGKPLDGRFLCGVEVLGHGDSDTYYLKVLCGDFPSSGEAMVSGGVSPAVVTVNEGASVVVSDVTFPRQAHLQEDIARLLPAALINEATDGSRQVTPSVEQLEQLVKQ